MSPIAVRRGQGPVHLAFPTAASAFQAVCGARFRGIGCVTTARAWRRDRRCNDCETRAGRARTNDELLSLTVR